VPAKLIRYTFIGLKPYYEFVKWKTFLANLGNEDAMRLFYPVDRWANENVDIPGEVFRKFVEEVYHEERLRRGLSRINGRRVDLRDITCPLMNLLATADWIVPPASAEVLNDLVGSRDRRLVKIDGAHVAIMVDPRTRPVWSQMSDFLLGN
jgi:polyhydroxyalkanoate synthase